jgi:hypothetical protein
MDQWKKFGIAWIVSMLVGFHSVFVMPQLWNWFAVPLLHAPQANYWLIYGLSMLFGLVTAHVDNPAHERRWNSLFIILDACVPPQNMEDVKEQVHEQTESIWTNADSTIFARVLTNSATLGLGFVVHLISL